MVDNCTDSFEESGWTLFAIFLVTIGVVSLISSGLTKNFTKLWNDYHWTTTNTVISIWAIISVIMLVFGFLLFFLQENSFQNRLQDNYTK